MDIYLVRHTSVNVEKGLCYGQAELPLASTFIQEAADTSRILPDKQSASFFASPSRRCIQLSEYLSRRPAITDKRLNELNFGEWELKRWEDIDDVELQHWMDNLLTYRPPGGETYVELLDRVSDFFRELTRKSHRTVIISTHAGVIRAALTYVLDVPFQRSFDIRLAHGGVTKVIADGDNLSIDYVNRV